MIIKTKEQYAEFKKSLQYLAKVETEENRLRHLKIVATQKQVIGLSMKDIRICAKHILKDDPISFLNLVKDDTYEEVMIWGIVCAGLKTVENKIFYFDRWKDVIDSWSLCDSVCCSIKNLQPKEEKIFFDWAYDLCFSKKEFVARFGIVLMLACFLKDEYIDKIIEMCNKIDNHCFYVDMALAWIICEIVVRFKYKGFELIKSQKMVKFVQNKAISKCHDSYRLSKDEKELLKKYRK